MRADEQEWRNHDATRAQFATTMWSVVLSARDLEKGGGAAALERLCATYWPSIYGFLRRRGHAPADAEDLTQGFLLSLLARSSLGSVAPQLGRFRSFLLASLRHYVSDQRDRTNAAKRGGGRLPVSLDAETAEGFYARQTSDGETPETIFDRQWADTLFKSARLRLQGECEAAGKAALHADIGPLRDAGAQESNADIAARHGMSENAVRIATHRLRQRYQELVAEQIRQTVSNPDEMADEIRYLIGIYSASNPGLPPPKHL